MIVALVTTMLSMFVTKARTPAEFDIIFDHAQNLYNESKYNDALKELSVISDTELIETDDTTKLFYCNLKGKIFLLKQEYASAKHYLSEAISLYESLRFKYPSYIDLIVYRAFASDALDEREEASRWYRKALIKGKVVEHNPDVDNNCYLNLGNYYNETGNYQLAKEYYDKIVWIDTLQQVEIHADYYGRQSEKYQHLGKLGEWDGAKKVNDSLTKYTFYRYGENHPFHLTCLQSEGTIQSSLHNYVAAEKAFKNIIEIGERYNILSSDVGYAYLRVIEMLCNQDSVSQAIDILPTARDYLMQLNDDNTSIIESYFFIGTSSVRIQDYETAILSLETFMANCPTYMQWGIPYAINKLTWSYLNIGRNNDVVDILTPILEQGNKLSENFQSLRPYLHKTLGCSHYVLGNRIESIKNLKKAISLLPEEMSKDSLIEEILIEYGEAI